MKPSRNRVRGISALAVVSVLMAACGFIQVNIPVAVPATAPHTQPASTLVPAITHTPGGVPAFRPIRPTLIATTATSVATPTPTAPPAEHIVPRNITGSLLLEPARSFLSIHIDGKNADGKEMLDDLNIERLRAHGLKQESIVMNGSLTTRVLASLTKSDTHYQFSQTGVYKVEDNAYWMVEYANKNAASCSTLQYADEDPFRQMTPVESLLLTTQKNLFGTAVGEERINGIAVQHYIINATASNSAALASEDWKAQQTSRVLKLTGGDVYLAMQGSYLVRFSAVYEGKITEFDFEGKARLEYNLTRPKASVEVDVPQLCKDAAARDKLPRTIGRAELLAFWPLNDAVVTGSIRSAITVTLNGKNAGGKVIKGGYSITLAENRVQHRVLIQMAGTQLSPLLGFPSLDSSGAGGIALYKIGSAVYWLVGSAQQEDALCVNVTGAQAGMGLADMRPEDLANLLAGADALYGRLAGNEKVNGIATRHYRLDAGASNSVIGKSTDAATRHPRLLGGDIYIASDGNFITRMSADYSGAMESMDFSGRMSIRFDLSTPSTPVEIVLPDACKESTSGNALYVTRD